MWSRVSKAARKSAWALSVAGVALVWPAALSNVSAAARAKPVTLNMYISGDVNVLDLWQSHLIPKFEKAYPNIRIRPIFSQHGALDASVLAKVAASAKAKQPAPFDILENGPVQALAQADLLQKLNTKEVPLLSHIDSSFLKANKYEAMPYRGSAVVIAYNSQFVKKPPKTLSALLDWIKQHPGKFTYNAPSTGGSGQAFVQAVLSQYIPKSDMDTFTTGYDASLEKDWAQGFEVLKSLTPYVYRSGFYPNGNTAVIQLLGSGAIQIAPVWSDQAISALSNGQLPPSVKLMQLTPPLYGGPAYLGVPNNSKYRKQADTLFNWLLQPQVQTEIINTLNAFPGVKWDYVPEAVRQKFADVASSYALSFSSQFKSDMNSQWQSKVPVQ